MKKTIIVLSLLAIVARSYGQPSTIEFTPPAIEADDSPAPDAIVPDDECICFNFNDETLQDSTVYLTEYRLEYGWDGDQASIVIENRHYNAYTDVYYDEEGNATACKYSSDPVEFIDGTFSIVNDRFIFTPYESEQYGSEMEFKIQYAPQSDEIEQLTDNDGDIWTKGDCYRSQIGINIMDVEPEEIADSLAQASNDEFAIAGPDDEERPELTDFQRAGTVKIVQRWIDEMFRANAIDHLTAISEVPFAVDNEVVLTTADELRDFYLRVVEDKGQREIPKYTIGRLEYVKEILWEYFPLNFVNVQVVIDDGEYSDKVIQVCVLIRDDTFKVIGFRD